MSIYGIKPAFQRRLMGLRDLCIRRGVSANALTFSALFLSVLGGAAIALSPESRPILIAVPFLAVGRLALNALDGMVAISSGTAHPFGEILNETTDRLSDILWFTGLAFVVGPVLALSSLVAVLVASYVGTVAKAAGGQRIYTGLMGKADRMIVLGIAAPIAVLVDLTDVFELAVGVIGIGSTITVIQRLIAARQSFD